MEKKALECVSESINFHRLSKRMDWRAFEGVHRCLRDAFLLLFFLWFVWLSLLLQDHLVENGAEEIFVESTDAQHLWEHRGMGCVKRCVIGCVKGSVIEGCFSRGCW